MCNSDHRKLKFQDIPVIEISTSSMEQSPSWMPTALQLVKKSPAFYETPRFNTAFTSARDLSIS
jgi:hypothetical protein